MRKSFNGQGEQIRHVLDEPPFSGHLFIFRGRRGDQIKVLWADSDGLCLFTKRLERGRFVWPVTAVAYGCYRALYESGKITEAACMAHARRKIHDVHARAPTDITTEALQRVGVLYAIEAESRGCTAEQRLAARKARAAPLMQSLYDWIQTQMKTLSHHSVRQKRSHTC